MSSSKPEVLEAYSRYIGTAELFINTDASWSIGPNTMSLVQVYFGDIAKINDDTFGFSAVAVESSGTGYTLYVRSDADGATIVQVKIDAAGAVDAASITVLGADQLYGAENSTGKDLNNSGGLGAEPVCVEGGATNLYKSATGNYQLGPDAAHLTSMTLGGQPLNDKILPAGWKIVETLPNATGFEVFAKAPTGDVYDATFSADGAYTGGAILGATELAAKETAAGVDINGDNSLPAAAGWTSVLKNALIKEKVDAAVAADGHITYAKLVSVMDSVIQAHKAAGDSPITADEVADLQALAGRGKALFATATGSGGDAGDYLAYVFSKMVESSPANDFYTGGQTKPVDLGNLAANVPLGTLEKLVDKWLLGGDLPTPTAGGDTATGKAATTVAVYTKVTGTLVVDGVTPNDIKQGAFGDCYLVATLSSVADVKPSAITSMIVDNGEVNGTHTWGVRFFDANGQANWVTVNDQLPVAEAGATTLVFASSGTAGNSTTNTELWVPLIEKAYAQANSLKFLPTAEKSGVNAYYAVEGGQGDPIAQILGGGKVTAYSFRTGVGFGDNPFIEAQYVDPSNADALAAFTATFKAALNGGKAIWIGADNPTTDSFGNKLLVGSHAFAATDHDKADPNNLTIDIWNPWGVSPLPSPPGPVQGGADYLSPFGNYDLAALIGVPGIDIMIGGPGG